MSNIPSIESPDTPAIFNKTALLHQHAHEGQYFFSIAGYHLTLGFHQLFTPDTWGHDGGMTVLEPRFLSDDFVFRAGGVAIHHQTRKAETSYLCFFADCHLLLLYNSTQARSHVFERKPNDTQLDAVLHRIALNARMYNVLRDNLLNTRGES